MVEIEEIREEYGIKIIIIYNKETEHGDWAKECISDSNQLEYVPGILRRALSPFPTDYVRGRLTIYIAVCFEEIEPEDGVFLLPTENSSGESLSCQMMDYTIDHFLKEGDYQDLENWNPYGFHYGEPDEYYVYHSDNPDDPNSYFLSLSAQDSPEKDIAEILTAVVNNEAFLHNLVPYTCIHDKIKYCCEQLVKWDEKFAAHTGVQIFLGEGQFLRNKYKRTAQSLS